MDRWGVWKEVRANADKVPELENRVDALEQRLQRAPGEACPKCGAWGLRRSTTGRVIGSFPMQHRTDDWTCEDCGHIEQKQVMMMTKP
jgi:predicted RNA-binding Zn-ribbon protein involved in translation (DUF1610 family)